MDISKLAEKLRSQDFGKDDSIIASSLMHPLDAVQHGANWVSDQFNRAANTPDPYDNPNPLRGYSPEQQVGGALNLAGLAQTGAFPMAPSGQGVVGSIKTWHGSPHKFEKFDFSKIGTGEGAQAFGHGGYFAENPQVAESYQNAGIGGIDWENAKYGGKKIQTLYDNAQRMQDLGHKTKNQDMINKANAELYYWESLLTGTHPNIAKANALDPDSGWPELQNFVNKIDDRKFKNINFPDTSLYEVSLEWPNAAKESSDPLGQHHMLDWDLPLQSQPNAVKSAWKNLADDFGVPVNEQELIGPTMMRAGLEQELYKRGIPGVKYKDALSRDSSGAGTSNYVIFDDNIPKIVSRNGVDLARILRGE